jgi:hypothetical protein
MMDLADWEAILRNCENTKEELGWDADGSKACFVSWMKWRRRMSFIEQFLVIE